MTDNLPQPTVGLPAIPEHQQSLISAVHDALLALDERLPQLAGHPDQQVIVHTELAELRANIKIITDRLEQMLLDECPTRENRNGRIVADRLVIEGLAVIEPADRGSTWVNVNYDRLLNTVIRKAWDDGEIENPTDVARIVSEVVTFSGIRSDARKGTGLARFGHDRSEFADYRPGTPGVRIIL